MTKESIVILPENRTITDEAEVERILEERDMLLAQRRFTSPADVLNGIDLRTVTLARISINPIGIHEVDLLDGGEPRKNYLFSIPDILVDLTPESEASRVNMGFKLVLPDKEVSIHVLFNDLSDEYREHYGDEEAIANLAENNLMQALQEKNWKLGAYDAWSVVK